MKRKALALTGLTSVLAFSAYLAGAPALAQDGQTPPYANIQARYAADAAAYHRGTWPDRYVDWTIIYGGNAEYLPGSLFKILQYTSDGTANYINAGMIKDFVRGSDGNVQALYVKLDNGKSLWIDHADLRYDEGNSLIVSNLSLADLSQMADKGL